MRLQHGLVRALVLACLVPLAGLRGETPARQSERAEQVRAVLRRHCLRCHGENPRAAVRILEQPLRVGGRQLVVPGNPDGSLLLDLVEGGSMPPGVLAKVPAKDRAVLREWIRAGATRFPAEYGRDYLLRQIAADFHRLPEASRAHVRYLSLNHIASQEQRRALATALRGVLRQMAPPGKEPAGPVAVEPTKTLLRIDLHEQGWDRRPFKDETLNLFDLLLLEYPYGVLPKAPLPPTLLAYLKQVGQVRAIPYVRADWLARVLTRAPLQAEFLTVLGQKAESPLAKEGRPAKANDKVAWADARRELETSPDEKQLEKAVAGIKDLAPLLNRETVGRDVWERHFLSVVGKLGSGVPIIPIDGETFTEHLPESSLKVEFRLVDADVGKAAADPPAKTRFPVGKDRYRIWVRTNQDAILEIVYSNPDDKKKAIVGKLHNATIEIAAGENFFLPGTTRKGLTILDNFAGRQVERNFTLYAYPKSELVGGRHPTGRKVSGGVVLDRYIHRFTGLKGGDGEAYFDPHKMVKVTIPVTFYKP